MRALLLLLTVAAACGAVVFATACRDCRDTVVVDLTFANVTFDAEVDGEAWADTLGSLDRGALGIASAPAGSTGNEEPPLSGAVLRRTALPPTDLRTQAQLDQMYHVQRAGHRTGVKLSIAITHRVTIPQLVAVEDGDVDNTAVRSRLTQPPPLSAASAQLIGLLVDGPTRGDDGRLPDDGFSLSRASVTVCNGDAGWLPDTCTNPGVRLAACVMPVEEFGAATDAATTSVEGAAEYDAGMRVAAFGQAVSDLSGIWPLDYVWPTPELRAVPPSCAVRDVTCGATPLYRRAATVPLSVAPSSPSRQGTEPQNRQRCFESASLSPFTSCSNDLFALLRAAMPAAGPGGPPAVDAEEGLDDVDALLREIGGEAPPGRAGDTLSGPAAAVVTALSDPLRALLSDPGARPPSRATGAPWDRDPFGLRDGILLGGPAAARMAHRQRSGSDLAWNGDSDDASGSHAALIEAAEALAAKTDALAVKLSVKRTSAGRDKTVPTRYDRGYGEATVLLTLEASLQIDAVFASEREALVMAKALESLPHRLRGSSSATGHQLQAPPKAKEHQNHGGAQATAPSVDSGLQRLQLTTAGPTGKRVATDLLAAAAAAAGSPSDSQQQPFAADYAESIREVYKAAFASRKMEQVSADVVRASATIHPNDYPFGAASSGSDLNSADAVKTEPAGHARRLGVRDMRLNGLIESRGEARGRLRVRVRTYATAVEALAFPLHHEQPADTRDRAKATPVVAAVDISVRWPTLFTKPNLATARIVPIRGFEVDDTLAPSNWSSLAHPCVSDPVVLAARLSEPSGIFHTHFRMSLLATPQCHRTLHLVAEDAARRCGQARVADAPWTVTPLNFDVLIDFAYAHLHADEYAPDMNRYYAMPPVVGRLVAPPSSSRVGGAEIGNARMFAHLKPTALLSEAERGAALDHPEQWAAWFDGNVRAAVDSPLQGLAPRTRLVVALPSLTQVRPRVRWAASSQKGLFTSPPIPDRAMPFNALAFWGTVVALAIMNGFTMTLRGTLGKVFDDPEQVELFESEVAADDERDPLQIKKLKKA